MKYMCSKKCFSCSCA